MKKKERGKRYFEASPRMTREQERGETDRANGWGYQVGKEKAGCVRRGSKEHGANARR